MMWKKYVGKELLRVFLLLLFGFYLFYIFIDFSLKAHAVAPGKLGVLILYYGAQLFKRLPLLFSIAFIVALMRLMLSWNQRFEWVAFQSAGLSKPSLLKPVWIFAFSLSLLYLISFEWITPPLTRWITQVEETDLKTKSGSRKPSVYALQMENKKLIYQWYDEKTLYDVAFIDGKTFWKMERLIFKGSSVKGEIVKKLEFNSEGHLVQTALYDTFSFPSFPFPYPTPAKRLETEEALPLSKLPHTALFYTKITHLFSPLLIVLLVPPFCFSFSRRRPPFLAFATALASAISYFALVDACALLSPPTTLFFPFIGLGIGGLLFRKRVVSRG